MRLVVVGNWLNGRQMFGQVGGHYLLHVLRSHRLLRVNTERQDEWRRQGNCCQRNRPCSLFTSHKHTSRVVRRLGKLFFTMSYLRSCPPLPRCWCQSP